MPIFSAACLAWKPSVGWNSAESINILSMTSEATSEEEAMGKGYKQLASSYPRKEGWVHLVTVTELPLDWLDKVLTYEKSISPKRDTPPETNSASST